MPNSRIRRRNRSAQFKCEPLRSSMSDSSFREWRDVNMQKIARAIAMPADGVLPTIDPYSERNTHG